MLVQFIKGSFMPEFKYRALKEGGEEVTGFIEADNNKEAISKIRAQNLFPTMVRRRSGRDYDRDYDSGPKITEDQLKMLLNNGQKTRNPFTIFKNYLRKKFLQDM